MAHLFTPNVQGVLWMLAAVTGLILRSLAP